MSMSDPLSDLLTRIRNGQAAGKSEIVVPASKLKRAVCQVLKDEGYIAGFADATEQGKPTLRVELKYYNGAPVIDKIRRVSKPGCRRYRGRDEMPKVMGGFGIAIVSTSKGVMSDRKARVLGEGGEILCVVQ
ncbi:30S ribosomal protein S8 [Methylococcus geothermalis]|uniref:Small ribosomal subunit protein uS8 n=1 Tax=Methylococcus geothermalis TaxID=2681310 RepID=A0A858QAT6_9GAMM|nr:30S ribosomal protein S8 [Methylococcus geothermalis]QJD31052.1 30S ribosomal protein S8 [Methylococcus geothermalis]